MNILRKIYITAFFLFLITLFPESAVSKNQGTIPGQIRVYLFEGGTGAEDSGVKNIYASLGDTITIDVYARNFKQVPVSAIEVYFTVDDDYFDIVSQGVNNAKNQYFGHFKPFIRGEYFKNVSGSSVLPHGNNTHGDSLTANDNIFDDWQLDYAEISGIGIGGERPVSRLRHGVIATFQLIAKAPCDSITISMDKDAYYMRVSSYYDPYDPNNYFFKSFETCYITVSGIEISPPLPDISMAPDTTDSSIDLDEHVGLASIPDSLMLWSASGNNMIGVNIDPVTHVVTFQTPSGFHGYEDIEFTVDDGSGNGDSDTLRVTVDHPPRLLTNAIPDTITIHEDTLEVALILSDIVVDEDDLFSSLTWEFSTDGNVNPSVIADILFLRGAQDYNGYDRLKIKVLDAFGLGEHTIHL